MKRTISFIVALAIMATMCVGFTLNVAAEIIESVSHACTQTHHDAVSFSKTDANSVVMQSVTVNASWVGIVFPGWGNDDGTATVEVFAFDTDLATSAAGTALLTETGVKINQVPKNEHRFSTPLPAGDYVIKFSNFAGTCYLGYGDKIDSSTLTSFENVGGPGTPSGHGLVISYILNRDTSVKVEADVDSTSDIVAANAKYTLVSDISGQVELTAGDVTIDLAGKTWSNAATALVISGTAKVTVIDSVGGGKIYARNDAIDVDGSSVLVLDGITVEADQTSCDAVFIKGGNVTVKNCKLDARQASVHNDNRNGATVLVDGCTLNGDDVALKGRNNAVITITGNTVFTNRNVEMQRDFDANRSVVDTFKAGKNATIEFDSIVVGNGVRTTVKSYTYTVPAPAFNGATIEISNGIALDFVVSNANDKTVVKVGDVELPSSKYDETLTLFTLSGFGPQMMAKEFKADLYVDGEFVDSMKYSVKAYCDAVLDPEYLSATDALKNLVKEVLVYGAKAQLYKNYETDNLVDAGITASGVFNAESLEDVTSINNDCPNASVTWEYANVWFGDQVELLVYLTGAADTVDVTIGNDTFEYLVATDDAGNSYISVDAFTPDQFKDTISFVAYNGGVKVSNTLNYSVASYVLDRVENSTNQAYVELVKALIVYGDAVAAL